jgi:hypothetical protein
MSHFRDNERADLRVISYILARHHKLSKPSRKMMEHISSVFSHMGGSWVLFFDGDPKNIALLKKVAKAVVKRSTK